jgi:hypothetical protein
VIQSINPMGDFEARAVNYFQRWTAHPFRGVRTNSVAIAIGCVVALATWAFMYRHTGDPLPWMPVLVVTLIYSLMAPLLVLAGRAAAIRAGAHVARIAEQLTYDVRQSASWDFLVSHFRNIHPMVVHTVWFQEILRRAAARCDRPSSRVLADWLAAFPSPVEPPTFEAPPPSVAAFLHEQGLTRLRWLKDHAHRRALASANRVRSSRIFQRWHLTSAQRGGLAYFGASVGLAFWSFITGSRRLTVLAALSFLVGVAFVAFHYAARAWLTSKTAGRFGTRFDRRFHPVGFWLAQMARTVVCLIALYGAVRLLPLLFVP